MAQNELYPIFLKVHQLDVLIVGGGSVALEKLTFMLKSSPNARVHLVAKEFDEALLRLMEKHELTYQQKPFEAYDLEGVSIVIGATNSEFINLQIYQLAKRRRILVNIADNPRICDFYMGSIVTKGNLKLGISTNGKSPTMAKRFRQYFEEFFPDDLDDLFDDLNDYRKTLKNDFKHKVKKLNRITQSLLED